MLRKRLIRFHWAVEMNVLGSSGALSCSADVVAATLPCHCRENTSCRSRCSAITAVALTLDPMLEHSLAY